MVFFSLRNCSLSSVVAPRSLLIATVVGHNNQTNQQIAVLWSRKMLQKYLVLDFIKTIFFLLINGRWYLLSKQLSV